MSKRIKENGNFDLFEIARITVNKKLIIYFLIITILTTIVITMLFFKEVNHTGSIFLLLVLYIVGIVSFQRNILYYYFNCFYKKDLEKAKNKMSKKTIKKIEYNANCLQGKFLIVIE